MEVIILTTNYKVYNSTTLLNLKKVNIYSKTMSKNHTTVGLLPGFAPAPPALPSTPTTTPCHLKHGAVVHEKFRNSGKGPKNPKFQNFKFVRNCNHYTQCMKWLCSARNAYRAALHSAFPTSLNLATAEKPVQRQVCQIFAFKL